MGRLEGKVAIVTGAASGIGEATALRFAEEGALTVLADLNEELGDDLVERAGGPERSLFVATDVANERDVDRLIEAAVERFGGLDVLFNNAGIGYFGATKGLDTGKWNRIIEVDLNSVFYGCRAAIPHLENRGGGAIVNTASVSGLGGDHAFSAYNAAKGAVVNYTRNLALDLGRIGIRANAVCPGLIETPLARGLVRNPNVAAFYAENHPMRRPGKASEVAALVAFLASDDASYVNGAIIPVDGGMTASNGQPDFPTLLAR